MFSIVIPLFNKRATIRQTIVSVVDQRFQDFELIVVDDGSTDGSIDQIADIADPRLTIIRQENRGEGPARNRGIESARGDWIALLDADDIWMAWHLEELDRVRSRFPDAGMIGTRWVEVDRDVPPELLARERGEPEVICYFEQSIQGPVLCSSTVAIRRTAHDDVGGFTALPVGADIEYWSRVALKWPVARSPVVTALYLRPTAGMRLQVSTPPDQELTQGIAAVIARLRREHDTIPAPKRAAVDRYVQELWTSRFRSLVSHEELRRARLLSTIAPAGVSASDRLRLLAIALPDMLAIASIRIAKRARAMVGRI